MDDVRGEIRVDIDGVGYTLRPTFDALRQIETRTGRSVLVLIQEVISMRVHYAHLVVTLYELARASGAKLTEERIGAAIIGKGIKAYLKPLSDVLQTVLSREEPDDSGKE